MLLLHCINVYFSGWFVDPRPPGGSLSTFGKKLSSDHSSIFLDGATQQALPSSDKFFKTTTLTMTSSSSSTAGGGGGQIPEQVAADTRQVVTRATTSTSSTSAITTTTSARPENYCAGGLFSKTFLAVGEKDKSHNMKTNEELIPIYSNDTENLFLEKKFKFNGAAAAAGADAAKNDFHNGSSSEEEALHDLSKILFDKATSVTLSVDEQHSERKIELQVVQFRLERGLEQAHPFCTSSRTVQLPQMKQLLRIKPDSFLSIETTTTFVGKVVRKNDNSLGGRLSSKEVYVDSLAYAVLYHNQLARYKFASRDEQFLKKHNLLVPETSVEEEGVRVMYCDIDLEVGDMVHTV